MTTLTTTTTPGIARTPPIDVGIELHHAGLVGLYLQLTKARLSALVLVTTAVGFILGNDVTSSGPLWPRLLWTILGTALAAGCANALNQIIEIQRDRRMIRTQRRPLPSGAMSISHSVIAALCMGIIGVSLLAALVNLISASLALLTILIYVLAYTPLKVRTTHNTWVGAVSGAIPPMIGWAAATGSLDRGAWVLAAILFVWQIPHFLALAWLYRDDYKRGGFLMLPVIDADGRLTTRVVVLTAALLLPLGLLAAMLQLAGPMYAIGSIILGVGLIALCLRLYFARSNSNARAVFLASIAYLPLLLWLMVLDRGV